MTAPRPLAVVTGASSGIGYELAKLFAADGHDLVVAADGEGIEDAARDFEAMGVRAEALRVDLATEGGVERLVALIGARPVAALAANAGHGLGRAFLDQEWPALRHVIDTNVRGTVQLLHAVGRGMRARGEGRVLITGSIAGFTPGAYQAVYNATKAFIDNFSHALREELKEAGVTVTCLMPGATDTAFFERADMMDTKVGTGSKDDAAAVARTGYDAMLRGDGDVVSGLKNKVQTIVASVTPAAALAHQHAKQARPGSAGS